ncbi:MAG: zinc-binding dehydrogenase, partial [Actinomycetota bacterium]
PNGIDGLIDAVNRDADAFASLAGLVRRGGRATSVIGAAGGSTRIGEVEVSNTGGNPAHLEALAARIGAGTLRVAISRTYPLGAAAQALKDFADEHTLGKLAIAME